MIKIDRARVVGIDWAVYANRNAFRSWDKSDSTYDNILHENYILGEADHEMLMKQAKGGHSHAKYRRFIVVYADITAPLYWWKQFDTYKVGTVGLSESTMHNVCDKVFEKDDFSHEHLSTFLDRHYSVTNTLHEREYDFNITLNRLIFDLNKAREMYLRYKEAGEADIAKSIWWQIIQLLPDSYNQHRTLMLNYEVLSAIYKDRRGHKLDEWKEFCAWIESLPYSELITLKEVE